MADKEGPSLEMPSFGFGRKKGKRGKEAADPSSPVDETSEVTEEPTREEAAVAEAAPVAPEPDPVPDDEPTPPPAEPAPAEETQRLDPVEHTPEPDAPPLFVDEAPPAATPVPETDDERTLAPEPAPEPRRRAPRAPALGGMTAAVVTGAFIGLLQVGLTWGSLHLCELVRGTSACGKPGFLVLLAIMIVLVLVGAVLLRAWGVNDPGATSFLGVGLVAVLLLLFLVQLLFNWWMVIVVPALGMVSFALAYWLSTAFVESD